MNTSKLADSLPWEPNSPPAGRRTILVNDTIETDGSFILHTLTSQYLSQSNNNKSRPDGPDEVNTRVVWISCGSSTERQITIALKKMGCDIKSLGLGTVSSSPAKGSPLRVLHVTDDIATILNDGGAPSDDTSSCAFSPNDQNSYLKDLYFRIVGLAPPEAPILVVVDDVSSLGCLFGRLTTYALLQKLRSSSQIACVAVRCSLDNDYDELLTGDGSVKGDDAEWIGAGGRVEGHYGGVAGDASHGTWERSLVELADGIVDVTPLPSGQSRDAHGRLVFTERVGGKGWCDVRDKVGWGGRKRGVSSSLGYVMNYAVGDGGVKAIRLRGGN